MLGKARLLLVQIDRDDVKMNRRARFEFEQNIEQTIAVLATRQAHHDFIAILNHIKIANRLTDLAAQAFFEFIVFELDFELGFVGGFVGHGVL